MSFAQAGRYLSWNTSSGTCGTDLYSSGLDQAKGGLAGPRRANGLAGPILSIGLANSDRVDGRDGVGRAGPTTSREPADGSAGVGRGKVPTMDGEVKVLARRVCFVGSGQAAGLAGPGREAAGRALFSPGEQTARPPSMLSRGNLARI